MTVPRVAALDVSATPGADAVVAKAGQGASREAREDEVLGRPHGLVRTAMTPPPRSLHASHVSSSETE